MFCLSDNNEYNKLKGILQKIFSISTFSFKGEENAIIFSRVFFKQYPSSSPDCNENPAVKRRNEVEPRHEELQ